MISLIAAMARNRVIGRDGRLAWHLPKEMGHFMRTTRGKPVVMGRRTFESLDAPLADRENIVVTRRRDYRAPGATVVHSLEEALERARGAEEVMVAGGEALYRESLPIADRLYLTLVDAELEGDTFFPELDPDAWKEVERRDVPADARHAYAFSIIVLDRRR